MTTEFDEAKAGDARRTWVDALYHRYSRALRRFLGRQRLSRDEVADIMQETYCRIQQAGNVDGIRNPKAFMFRVANNLRLNEQKRYHRRIEGNALDIRDLDLASDEPSPYRILKGEQELEIVRAAFAELPPKCRKAFVMNRFESLTFAQIAAELDLSVSMIEKHVSHAISHMRKRLSDERPASDRDGLRVPAQGDVTSK